MAIDEYGRILGTLALGSGSICIITGAGSPDGDTDPWRSAAKGSLHIRSDATDDHSPWYLKTDSDLSDNDWVQVFVATQASAANFNADLTFLTDKRVRFRDSDGGWWYSTSGSVMQGGAASSVHIGDGTNDMVIEADGHVSFAGTARAYRDVRLPAEAFGMSGCVSDDPVYDAGSMMSASLSVDVTASAFADITAGVVRYDTLQPSADVAASMTHVHATFAVPTDADTSGCVDARAVWTAHDEHATAGSVFAVKGRLTYISGSAAERTAASTGACPSYEYTASGVFYETSLGSLPSFGANDAMGIFTLCHDQGDGDDTGGSGIAFLGVKLRYVAHQLGEPL